MEELTLQVYGGANPAASLWRSQPCKSMEEPTLQVYGGANPASLWRSQPCSKSVEEPTLQVYGGANPAISIILEYIAFLKSIWKYFLQKYFRKIWGQFFFNRFHRQWDNTWLIDFWRETRYGAMDEIARPFCEKNEAMLWERGGHVVRKSIICL